MKNILNKWLFHKTIDKKPLQEEPTPPPKPKGIYKALNLFIFQRYGDSHQYYEGPKEAEKRFDEIITYISNQEAGERSYMSLKKHMEELGLLDDFIKRMGKRR